MSENKLVLVSVWKRGKRYSKFVLVPDDGDKVSIPLTSLPGCDKNDNDVIGVGK